MDHGSLLEPPPLALWEEAVALRLAAALLSPPRSLGGLQGLRLTPSPEPQAAQASTLARWLRPWVQHADGASAAIKERSLQLAVMTC